MLVALILCTMFSSIMFYLINVMDSRRVFGIGSWLNSINQLNSPLLLISSILLPGRFSLLPKGLDLAKRKFVVKEVVRDASQYIDLNKPVHFSSGYLH